MSKSQKGTTQAATAPATPTAASKPPAEDRPAVTAAVETIVDAEYDEAAPEVGREAEVALAIPGTAALDVLGGGRGADQAARYSLAYVGYRSPKTREPLISALNAVGVEPEKFFLFDQEHLKVQPFEYHLIDAKQYGNKSNNAGKTVAVRVGWDDKWRTEGFKQAILAFILVRMADADGKVQSLVPASWQTNNALVQAVVPAISYRRTAEDAVGYALRGPAHKVAAEAKSPGGRYICTAWGITEATRDGENDFNKGVCRIRPTDSSGVALFNEMVGPKFDTAFRPAYEAFLKRCAYHERTGQPKQS